MIQVVIFYEKSQKLSSDWGKPPDVIRLSYNSLLSAANSNLNSKKLGIFAELALKKIILLTSNLNSNKSGRVRKTKFKD